MSEAELRCCSRNELLSIVARKRTQHNPVAQSARQERIQEPKSILGVIEAENC